MELKSAVAIVTGAGRGIGRAIAQEYGKRGAKVALASRTATQIEAVAREIRDAGGSAIAVPTDVSDPAAVDRLVARAEKELGPIDILVNNAGAYQAIGPVSEVPPERWLSDIKTNLYGPMLCAQAALKRMLPRKRGYVLNVIGGGVQGPIPNGSGYACSKAALMRLTECIAAEVAGTGVKVFAMSPGLVRTQLVDYQINSPEGQRYLAQRLNAMFDEGRGVPPTLAAKLACELVSGRFDKLVGRALRAQDDLEAALRMTDEIIAKDLRVLRMVGYG